MTENNNRTTTNVAHDQPTIAERSFEIGEWSSGPGRLHDGPAPHFHSWADRRDPINQYRVEWADDRHESPIAVQDIDGCRALIVGPSERHQYATFPAPPGS